MRTFYLNILGLKKNASATDIKKAYRKQAFKYHPDKNNSPNAEKMFLLISHAYDEINKIDSKGEEKEVSEEKDPIFSKKYHKTLTQEEIEKHRVEANYERLRKEEREKNILKISLFELENSLVLKISNTIALFSVFFALILFIDLYILQPKSEIGIAESFMPEYNGQRINIRINNSEKLLTISTSQNDPYFQVIRDNYVVEVFKTPILGEIASIRNFGHRKYHSMRNQSSVYSLFWVIFTLLILPITNFAFKGANSFYIIFIHLNIGLPLIGFLIFFSF